MKILVTGSNGFVGRHLTSHLESLGHTVGSGVRSPDSTPAWTTEVVIGDLSGETDWTGLLQGFDVVIHLAARVHVMNDTSVDPLSEFRRVNSLGTAALARAAATQGVTRLVFLSSIKVNGESTSGRGFTASDRPTPNDPYGISKHEAEIELRKVARDSALEIVIVRTPLVYGPGVKGNFAKMLSLVRLGVPLPLGALRNRRTMVSVWNLIDLLEKCAVDPRAAGALVLAGDAFSPSTPQLLKEMTSAMGKKSRVFPLPLAVMRLGGRLTGKTAIVSRLTESLEVAPGSSSTDWGWKPPHAFADSILRTVTWDLENRKSQIGGRRKLKEKRKSILFAVTIDESLQFVDGVPALLVAAGWKVHVISSPGPRSEVLAQTAGVQTHALAMRRKPSPVRDLWALAAWLRLLLKIRPTVVVAGTPKASLLGLSAARLVRVPNRVYVLHGLRLETSVGAKRRHLMWAERWANACATRVFAVSPSLRMKALECAVVGEEKISVIGAGTANGISSEEFDRARFDDVVVQELRDETGLKQGVPVIGFVGRLTRDKGLADLQNALTHLRDRGVACQLLLVGRVDDASGAVALDRLKDTGVHVVATGQVDNPAIYYRLMDVFCLPSLREGFSTVVLEASASGLPVVVSNATGVVDSVLDGRTGLVYPTGHSEKLADRLECLLSNPVRARMFGDQGKKWVARVFARDEVQAAFIAEYEALVRQ